MERTLHEKIVIASEVRHMKSRLPAGLVGLSFESDRRKLVDTRKTIGQQTTIATKAAITGSTTAKTTSGHEAIRNATSAVVSSKCHIVNRGSDITGHRQAIVWWAHMVIRV